MDKKMDRGIRVHFTGLKFISASLLVLSLVGCTTSEFVISSFYNRMPKQMVEEFENYVELEPQQKEWVKEQAATFHQWHKTQELPQIAALLREISSELRTGQDISRDQVDRWGMQVNQLSQRGGNCSPMVRSAALIVDLSDAQVESAVKQLDGEYEEVRDELQKMDSPEWLEDKVKRNEKFFKMLGFELTPDLKQQLPTLLKADKPLRRAEAEYWSDWLREMILLLENRRAHNGEQLITDHFIASIYATEQLFPEQLQERRNRWRNWLVQAFNNPDLKRREKQADRFEKFAQALSNISDKGREEMSLSLKDYCPKNPTQISLRTYYIDSII